MKSWSKQLLKACKEPITAVFGSMRAFSRTPVGVIQTLFADTIREAEATGDDLLRRQTIDIMILNYWLRSGRQSVVITAAAAAELDRADGLAWHELPGEPGECYEFLLPWSLYDMGPDHGWLSAFSWHDGAGWGCVLYTGNALLQDFMDGIIEDPAFSGVDAPTTWSPDEFAAGWNGQNRLVHLSNRALAAYKNPEIAFTEPVELSRRERRRRQHKRKGWMCPNVRTLKLHRQATATLQIVQPVVAATPALGPTVERRAHTVRGHGAIRWVLAPEDHEEVVDQKVHRTAVVDGIEHHTWLYAVRRKTRPHVRGKGPLTWEPRLTVLQPETGGLLG